MTTAQPLKFGMVGGGIGSFIGEVHRRAAAFDGQAIFTAGALSSDPDRARESGRAAGLPDDRAYTSWQDMLDAELSRPENDRIDFVSVVTPNDTHFDVARAFVDAGIHVVIDKPMVHTSEQAEHLARLADEKRVLIAVTYNYTGYPMVREARRLVRDGRIGTIRKVFIEYHQGWLATPLEQTGMKQAAWRTDPNRAGPGGALGDIGSHAENLAAFITGLDIDSLCADLSTFVEGRALDDDAAILIRYAGGAKGALTCSQVCVGEGNNLSIRIYADKGAITWRQENAEVLRVAELDRPPRILTRGGVDLGEEAAASTRLPEGHPEGFNEAFANIYRGVCDAIRARRTGDEPSALARLVPDVRDGARGVRFIERAVGSARQGATWVSFA